MALQRPITKALACHKCQQWILRSFITAVGGAQVLQPGRAIRQQRPFSVARRKRIEKRERVLPLEDEDDHPINEINEEFAATSTNNTNEPPQLSTPPPQPKDTLPWYLQHAPPIQSADNPLLARQQLPPLPPHPPPILQPLQEHLSTALGINDLTLLDLRALDPPPALGANLLMLVGTARSERHLHTTADRLCRFLRSDYHIHPHADGLLGRNELKLKLKRRAKRSRLLSAVGAKATAQTEIEDGIRTGWVCVNVGRVDGGELPALVAEREKRMEKIVGFGPSESGCSIVVQLMTEEKRGEVDLETLWNENLVQASRKREKEGVSAGDENDASEAGAADLSSEATPGPQGSSSSISSSYYHFASVSNQSTGQQVRMYHTSARKLHATAINQPAYFENKVEPHGASNDIVAATSSADKLGAMLVELKAMTPYDARRVLGHWDQRSRFTYINRAAKDFFNFDFDTTVSAPRPPRPQEENLDLADEIPVETPPHDLNFADEIPFVNAFYSHMPPYPTAEHWHHHIALLAYARRMGWWQIHTHQLIFQLTNMQIAGLVPQERTFHVVLEAALTPLGSFVPDYDGAEAMPTNAKLEQVLSVMEDMEGCGYNAMQPSFLAALYQACVALPPIRPLFASGSNRIITEELSLAGLRRLVRTGDWAAFWQRWRSYPQRFLPRTAGMYGVLYGAIGNGRLSHVLEASEVLRTALEEMETERPTVRVEGNAALASAVMRALESVEPRLRGSRREVEGGGLEREWIKWYERCWSVAEEARQQYSSIRPI